MLQFGLITLFFSAQLSPLTSERDIMIQGLICPAVSVSLVEFELNFMPLVFTI